MSVPEPAVLAGVPPAGPALAARADEPGTAEDVIRGFFEPRAADVDGGRAGVREGLALLAQLGLAHADVGATSDLIAAVARSDLTSAFSAWAHRMVVTYVRLAPPGSTVRELLPDLAEGALVGSTAMAAATAHLLTGSPIPLASRREDGHLRLEGRINWASNLLPPFLCVTAATDHDGGLARVVAFRDDAPGLGVSPYPQLLALDATGSTSLRLDGVPVAAGWIISEDLPGFLRRVLPEFLLLQSAFCRGLAERAMAEAEAADGPTASVVAPELERCRREVERATARSRELAREAALDPAAVPLRELLSLRLEWTRLAGEAVRLELVLAGGRGYIASSGTARRVREAAFLPVQAPTEVMLRWILSRSA